MTNYATLIIVILILILVYVLFLTKPINLNKIYKYNEIRHKLKTGDILLFPCKKQDDSFGKLKYYFRTNLLGSEFGHVGLVVRENNELYLLECTDVRHTADGQSYRFNKYGRGGIRIVKLEYLLNKYHKKFSGIFGVRFISNKIPTSIIFKEMSNFKDKIFESRTTLTLLGFVDMCLSHNIASELSNIFSADNKIMCGQFTHHLLYNCGVLKDYKSELFWPHLFDDNKAFDHLQNMSYSKTCHFTLK